jgi:hypothetical protein
MNAFKAFQGPAFEGGFPRALCVWRLRVFWTICLEEEIRIWKVMTYPRHRITRLRPDDEANDVRSSQALQADAGFEHSENP